MKFVRISRLIGFTYFCHCCSKIIQGQVWSDMFKVPIEYYCEDCITLPKSKLVESPIERKTKL